MTGIVGVQFKIMPTSPSVNLEKIKENAKKIIEKYGGVSRSYIEEPIAFGLKAIIAFFSYDESKDTEEIEEALREIEDVQSVQMIDIRKIA